MLAPQRVARPWNSKSLQCCIFEAWASVCPRALAIESSEIVPLNSGSYHPRRCVTLHMYEKGREFEIPLRQLWNLFEEFFSSKACKDLIGIVGIAVRSMSFVQIKTMSYKGAVFYDNRWSDPGNFIYTIWWNIWGQMARYLQRRQPTSASSKSMEELRSVAGRVTDVQRMVRERWNREPDTSRWLELIGDLMELGLGAGHVDPDRFWNIIQGISPIICSIRSILTFVDQHGSFARTGKDRRLFRGPCAPHTRKFAVAMFHGMQVHKFNVTESSEVWVSYLIAASENRLQY